MKRALVLILLLAVAGGVATGGVWLWGRRPWRTAIVVNGRAITAGELDLRAKTLYDDAVRVEHLMVSQGFEGEAMVHYRREAAKMWIVKEVLLSEAVARGVTVTAADEKESMAQAAKRLKSRNMTLESFFKEGPLPEELKRRDFQEGTLVGKFTRGAITDKVNVTPAEIEQKIQDLKKLSLLQGEGKTPVKTDRKTAINLLRAEKYRQEFRKLFRSLYLKSDVKCPLYPEMEKLEGVSPSRPEDEEGVKK